MRFFARNIISSMNNMRKAVGFGNGAEMGKTVCGSNIEAEGITNIWGSPSGFRAVIVKHDAQSKIRAENDAQRIRAMGGEPKTVVTKIIDDSKWVSDGIYRHEYTWSTKDASAENQNQTSGPNI